MHSILVVEDNPDVACVIKIYLESRGHEVHTAGTAEEALQLLHAHKFCAAVMDYHVDGFSAAGFVAEARKVGVTVVLVSGVANMEQKKKELGLKHGLVKPFEPDVLVDMLEKICA